ncbi:anti-anti-sigma factor [Leptospira perolatii]|uniref:Anti-anti-sigma factor n=1 Tax=Leptospira perolatii TaxID=2023191 RepID=A0A2M9ZSW9_9LEPT|nr:STAS domain-containing protein [Leptospira perolatii]PJZ71587.1 anti-anti-sigma factor [Leptospira perolatii]PJZ75202.1 anti-anti-sigma factor [Leptospira perolatii]
MNEQSNTSDTIKIEPDLASLFNDYYSFRNQLMDAIASKPSKVLIDLGRIPAMNSICISSLVWFAKEAKLASIEVEMVRIHPDLYKTFELLRVNDYFRRT